MTPTHGPRAHSAGKPALQEWEMVTPPGTFGAGLAHRVLAHTKSEARALLKAPVEVKVRKVVWE